MALKTSAVPFSGTAEQEKKLLSVIEDLRETEGSLMRVLQEAQGIYGYLPYEVLTLIAAETGTPLEKIYGVATFYSQFSLYPKGKNKISVCLGTACYVKGAGDIFKKLQDKLGVKKGDTPDGLFSLEDCRCIGACGLAPVLTVNSDVYGRLTGDELDEILAKYKE